MPILKFAGKKFQFWEIGIKLHSRSINVCVSIFKNAITKAKNNTFDKSTWNKIAFALY